MPKKLCLALIVCLLGTAARAEDFETERLRNWHQWRGPNADGVAPEADPPLEWAEDKNIKWKVEIPGKGSASPVVWGDRIFLLTAIATQRKGERAPATGGAPPASEERPRPNPQRPGQRPGRPGGGFGRPTPPDTYHQFVVLCLNRNTGETIWQRVAAELVPHEGHHNTNTFASGSATTDGQFVYASFGSRGIYCYDMGGELIWNRDLGHMQTRNGFGEGTSPTIYKDTLIVNWDHEAQSCIFGLDAKTGETRWRKDRDEVTTWATPLVVEHGGKPQVVTNGTKRVRSYDLATGELLWECGGQATNPIPSPVTAGGLVYCMTGYQGYAVYAIPLDASGDITKTDKVAWSRTDSGPYVSSPVLYGGHVYFTKGRDPILSCLDAKTGEPTISQQRIPGLGQLYASPVAAAGRLYFTARDGTTVVLRHGRSLEVLATNNLDEGIDASPALVGRQMFLRGERHLYCVEQP